MKKVALVFGMVLVSGVVFGQAAVETRFSTIKSFNTGEQKVVDTTYPEVSDVSKILIESNDARVVAIRDYLYSLADEFCKQVGVSADVCEAVKSRPDFFDKAISKYAESLGQQKEEKDGSSYGNPITSASNIIWKR